MLTAIGERSIKFSDSDVLWALCLAIDRHSQSVGRGERDTRGVGNKPGLLDHFGIHDMACLAVSIASGSAWRSCEDQHASAGLAHSDVDFEATDGGMIVVACEACPAEVEIPVDRIKAAKYVVLVMRQADERIFRVIGVLTTAEIAKFAKKTTKKCFDPSVGKTTEAVSVPHGQFVFSRGWASNVTAHNELIVPELAMDLRKASRNPRIVDIDMLRENDVTLNHQLLLKALMSASAKRFRLGFKAGVGGGESGSLESHFTGALGERGLILLGFRFLSPPNTYKKMDFDNNIWLGTRSRNDWDLIVQPEDLEKSGFQDRRYVLAVQKSVDTMRYVGWITGAEIAQLVELGLAPLEDPTGEGRKKAHFVKQRYLTRTMDDLIAIVASEATLAKTRI